MIESFVTSGDGGGMLSPLVELSGRWMICKHLRTGANRELAVWDCRMAGPDISQFYPLVASVGDQAMMLLCLSLQSPNQQACGRASGFAFLTLCDQDGPGNMLEPAMHVGSDHPVCWLYSSCGI